MAKREKRGLIMGELRGELRRRAKQEERRKERRVDEVGASGTPFFASPLVCFFFSSDLSSSSESSPETGLKSNPASDFEKGAGMGEGKVEQKEIREETRERRRGMCERRMGVREGG